MTNRTTAYVNGFTDTTENTMYVVRRVIGQIDKNHFNLTTEGM